MKIRKIMQVFLCLTLCLTFVLSGCAHAETRVKTIRTNETGVSLRSSPEKTDTNKICGVHQYVYLDVLDLVNGWYYVCYNGQYGYVSSESKYVTITDWYTPTPANGGVRTTPTPAPANLEPYDMGVPYIGSQVYRKDNMNMVVFWVQTQLKATGVFYQGEQWDVTGSLGDHTMEEIRAFMQTYTGRGHSGVVDQSVIDALASWLGDDVQPVYVGGFYDAMDSLMVGGTYGSMYSITSNLRDGVARSTLGARWVQTVLSRLGYYNSSIDGKYGEQTQEAVMQFQDNHNFQERDYVSLGVARAMLEQYYYRGYPVNRLP